MNIAFIQDYADGTVAARQRAVIAEYARREHIEINEWVDANRFSPEMLNSGDMLLVEKTFRLAKDMRSIALLLEKLLAKGVLICSCEDGLRFGGGNSAELASSFGVIAKIAEDLRSQLTKEGLNSSKAAGQKLGRPYGALSKQTKLSGHEIEIAQLLQSGCSRRQIAIRLHAAPNTLASFIKRTPELTELIDA